MTKVRNFEPGFILGRYELVFRVATGGMGEVWAARLKGTRGFQKVVALKFLLPELSHNPNFEQMFLDEAELASRIKHPNVVQVTDLGEEDEILYQVMEWVSGESLWTAMRAATKKGGVPLEVAARIICQVCAGLHAAHELRDDEGKFIGLVHRDVSPQNVLLTRQGIAKVVDFGVAKFAGRGVAATQVGELKGKVPYMAPEHIHGKELDRRADVFSIGVLFYQLIAGAHPFLADNDQLTMARISSPVPAVSLRSRVPSIPAELSRVVDAALAKDREKRTKTALELMHEIERAVPGASMSSTNDLVSAWLKDLVGRQIDARDDELREALRDLDLRSSIPPESMRSGRRGTMPSIAALPPSEPPNIIGVTPSPLPPPPSGTAAEPLLFPLGGESEAAPAPKTAPPVFAESTSTETAIERASAKPEPASFLGRHIRAFIAAGAVAVAVFVLVLAGGTPNSETPSGSGDNASGASASPASGSATGSARSTAGSAEPASTAATPSNEDDAGAPAAGSATASDAVNTAMPAGSTAAPPSVPGASSSATKAPWKKKKEYTPGGI